MADNNEKELKLLVLATEFRSMGMGILNRPTDGSLLTQSRRFRAAFGTSWKVNALLWKKIEKVTEREFKQEQQMHPGQNVKRAKLDKKYLLCALYHMKTYQTEHVAASAMKCGSEKIYRNKVREYMSQIAFLKPMVVSFFYLN